MAIIPIKTANLLPLIFLIIKPATNKADAPAKAGKILIASTELPKSAIDSFVISAIKGG